MIPVIFPGQAPHQLCLGQKRCSPAFLPQCYVSRGQGFPPCGPCDQRLPFWAACLPIPEEFAEGHCPALPAELPKCPAPATATSASFGGCPSGGSRPSHLVRRGSSRCRPSPGVTSPPLPRGLTPNDIPPICTCHLLPPLPTLKPALSPSIFSPGRKCRPAGGLSGRSDRGIVCLGIPPSPRHPSLHPSPPPPPTYLPAPVQPPNLGCIGSGSSLPSFQMSHGGGALDLMSPHRACLLISLFSLSNSTLRFRRNYLRFSGVSTYSSPDQDRNEELTLAFLLYEPDHSQNDLFGFACFLDFCAPLSDCILRVSQVIQSDFIDQLCSFSSKLRQNSC